MYERNHALHAENRVELLEKCLRCRNACSGLVVQSRGLRTRLQGLNLSRRRYVHFPDCLSPRVFLYADIFHSLQLYVFVSRRSEACSVGRLSRTCEYYICLICSLGNSRTHVIQKTFPKHHWQYCSLLSSPPYLSMLSLVCSTATT